MTPKIYSSDEIKTMLEKIEDLEKKNKDLANTQELYANAMEMAEMATADIAMLRQQLTNEFNKTRAAKEEVERKNIDLLAANKEIEAMNEVLIETKNALWGEMELAKKIQTVLLPKNPTMVDYSISACMIPADEVGGDYYDIINTGDINWIVIGDVSGHGVSAGLVMMMVQTSIRSVLNQNPSLKPSKLLDIVNDVISQNIKKLGETKYMTITVLANFIDGKFTFSGLHLDILLFRSKKNVVELVETQGMWLGLGSEYCGTFNDQNLSLEPGDILCLYTDGITEARNESDKMFSTNRLTDLLHKYGENSPDLIKTAIIDDLKNFEQKDDITLVIIKKER